MTVSHFFSNSFSRFATTCFLFCAFTILSGSIFASGPCSSIPSNSQKNDLTILPGGPPVAKCHATKTVYLSYSGSAGLSAFSVDNHSIAPNGVKGYSLSPANSFDCSNIGNNTVILKVTDSNDQFSTCSSNIIVKDTVRPTLSCKVHTVNLDAKGKGTITPEKVENYAKDNCNGVKGIETRKVDISSFDCSNIPSSLVVLTVTDKSGNENSCSAVMHIVDKMPPVAVCRNATVKVKNSEDAKITVKDIDNGTSDNCTLGTMTVKPTAISAGQSKTVTLTVFDAAGNASTCSSSVSVAVVQQ